MRASRVFGGVVVFAIMAVLPCRAAEKKIEIDRDVLALRESAWRAWFSGDEPALRSMLPAEFIAISTGEDISDLEKTVANSRAFKEAGGKLISLSFPETRAQRFGDTVVLYGTYEALISSGGKEQTMSGRLTEVFVKRGGRWVHPGWHLDAR